MAWLRVWLRVSHGCIRSQPSLRNLKARPQHESPFQVAQGQCQLVPRASVPPMRPLHSRCVSSGMPAALPGASDPDQGGRHSVLCGLSGVTCQQVPGL